MTAQAPSPEIVTYTADLSICAQICRLVLEEHQLAGIRDVEVDIEYTMENYEAWFVRIQPKMTVPVMQYDGLYVGDSKEIMYFVAQRHSQLGLYPPAYRGPIDAFIDDFYNHFRLVGAFTFGHLQVQHGEPMQRFVRRAKTTVTTAKLRALLRQPEFETAARARLEQIAQRDLARMTEPGILTRADRAMTKLLAAAQTQLARGGGPWLMGPAYPLADVVATALLARIHLIKGQAMFTPPLIKYWERLQARPSFRSASVCSTWDDTAMSVHFAAFSKDSAAC